MNVGTEIVANATRALTQDSSHTVVVCLASNARIPAIFDVRVTQKNADKNIISGWPLSALSTDTT